MTQDAFKLQHQEIFNWCLDNGFTPVVSEMDELLEIAKKELEKENIIIPKSEVPQQIKGDIDRARYSYYQRTGTGGCFTDSHTLRNLTNLAKLVADRLDDSNIDKSGLGEK